MLGISCSTKPVHSASSPDCSVWMPSWLLRPNYRINFRRVDGFLDTAFFVQDSDVKSSWFLFCQPSRLAPIPADGQQQWQIFINRYCCVLSAHFSTGPSNSKWLGLHSPVLFEGTFVPHLITPKRKGFASGSIRSRFASYRC